ncbi:hypothetical protein SISNIDRAFT_412611 [Sistotremastrum niveocremeum HHB9708]|uniref:CS domain-containing protein n=2 Tax=Sistotremastraceae TaxID=3402574 RepID=A0A164TSB5_9AGAM|nr:hypothetical protein SISNIDRAFT_412611 [Sistotremastrum niveocremeum HHB9708]KZT42262.1 hypothetical protein SISSUDRAFT_1058855 [Sistotremastrum suecicum HHB10207 ss-3]
MLEDSLDRQGGYSWHQAHDQATVLFLVPYETAHEDVVVRLDQNFIVAGVRDQIAIVKGRLYGNVLASSSWQLEARSPIQHPRERTTSTTSTTSNHSSFAFISSEVEISSSFAASLASGRASVADDYIDHARSTGRSTPSSTPVLPKHRSIPGSPAVMAPSSLTSSFSSVESLPVNRQGRLLTLYLEKAESAIWPCLITGPVPASIARPLPGPPGTFDSSIEEAYNMDATSLTLRAVELLDVKNDKDEGFEFFIRAWHQAHNPISTLRLAEIFLPVSEPVHLTFDDDPEKGSSAYYLNRLGGLPGLARLYLEAGLLYLEGGASAFLSSTSTLALSSLRHSPTSSVEIDSEAMRWRRDREMARKLFHRARSLDPHLDVPILPPDSDPSAVSERDGDAADLRMPTVDILNNESQEIEKDWPRRRKSKVEQVGVDQAQRGHEYQQAEDNWYVYIPGLVGAGTALVLVGIVGVLSFGPWRKTQNS